MREWTEIMLGDTQKIRITSESPEKRGAWYLLTGVILGLILGLVYAWVIDPVVYENTSPVNLAQAEKDAYRAMIAQVYVATGNLERATLRLLVLEDEDPIYALGAQAQRALATENPEEARVLAMLASALYSDLDNENDIDPTIPADTSMDKIIPSQASRISKIHP